MATHETDDQSMRLFVALRPSAKTLSQVVAVSQALADCGNDLKLSRPDNIHLTLAFLGMTHVDQIEQIQQALSWVSGVTHSFELQLSRLALFPGPSQPHHLVCLVKPNMSLMRLEQRIRFGLSDQLTSQLNRPFMPHVTLGRWVEPPPDLFELPNLPLISWAVNQAMLVNSVPSSNGGSDYKTIAEFIFGDG